MTQKDYFQNRNGIVCSGSHLIIDVYNAEMINNIEHMENFFKEAVIACGATLLKMNFHTFEPNGGISGVAILAESHISIHTWPEFNYFALDVFMCGDAETKKIIPLIKKFFNSEKIIVNEFLRGQGV